MEEISIVSIVGSGKLGVEVDLDTVSQDIDAHLCRYNPDRFAGIYLKFEQNGPSVSLYRTGSYGVRGGSTHESVYEHKDHLLESLDKLGIDTSHQEEFSINNIVFTGEIGDEINLNELIFKLGLEATEYEPEQFPGLVYRFPSGVALIFSSGKCILTGFKSRECALEAYESLKSEINE